jgi:hypothetical protein
LQYQYSLNTDRGQAGFADFGLFFDLGLIPGSQSDDLAEELPVDLAERGAGGVRGWGVGIRVRVPGP